MGSDWGFGDEQAAPCMGLCMAWCMGGGGGDVMMMCVGFSYMDWVHFWTLHFNIFIGLLYSPHVGLTY